MALRLMYPDYMKIKTTLITIALLFFTLGMWALFLWLFGEWGIMLIVISGYTMPIWASVILEGIGVDK